MKRNNNQKSYEWLIKPLVFILGLLASVMLVLWIEKTNPSDLAPLDSFFQNEVLEKEEVTTIGKTGSSTINR